MPRKKKVQAEETPKEEEPEKVPRSEPFYYPKIHCELCGELKKSNQILMDPESKKLLCKNCKKDAS